MIVWYDSSRGIPITFRWKRVDVTENAQKWIEALRSGQFMQTRCQLTDGVGYCCLGVACEVYRRETGRGTWQKNDHGSKTKFRLDYTAAGVSTIDLPQEVANWLGLRSRDGSYHTPCGGTWLTADNDQRKRTLRQIADIIESEPEGLFV